MRFVNQVHVQEDIVESFNSDVNSSSFMWLQKDTNIAIGMSFIFSKELFFNGGGGGYIEDETVVA